jgi:hypothetical protein
MGQLDGAEASQEKIMKLVLNKKKEVQWWTTLKIQSNTILKNIVW